MPRWPDNVFECNAAAFDAFDRAIWQQNWTKLESTGPSVRLGFKFDVPNVLESVLDQF